jgi:hypothetical protein
MQVPQDCFHSPWVQILSNEIKALELSLAPEKNQVCLEFLNLVFTIPECLPNSIKWSLSVKHTFLVLYLMYYSGNVFRLSIESSSRPYIKITDP